VVTPGPGGGTSNVLPIIVLGQAEFDLLTAWDFEHCVPGQPTFSAGVPGLSSTMTLDPMMTGPCSEAMFVGTYSGNPVGGGFSAGQGQDAVYFDLRSFSVSPDDSMTITVAYPASAGNDPQLMYYDASMQKFVPMIPTSISVDSQHHKVTFTLDNSSTPRLAQLNGTVFALTVSAPPSAGTPTPQPTLTTTTAQPTSVTVTPALALVGESNNFAQTTTFLSSGQLGLSLAASSNSQTTAGRTTLSAATAESGNDDLEGEDYFTYLRRVLGDDLFWDWLQTSEAALPARTDTPGPARQTMPRACLPKREAVEGYFTDVMRDETTLESFRTGASRTGNCAGLLEAPALTATAEALAGYQVSPEPGLQPWLGMAAVVLGIGYGSQKERNNRRHSRLVP
jgi:hypothetical protein